MLDNNLIQSTSSWPFVEVRKLLKDRKAIIAKKKKITFQTGYGPSGHTFPAGVTERVIPAPRQAALLLL